MGYVEVDNKKYAIILSDGSVRIPTSEQNPDAVKREIETSDGRTMTKYELVKKGLKGRIIGITFKETDFGKVMNVAFHPEDFDGEQVILSLSVAQNFADDLMKKLPNVNFEKEVSLSPYSFTDDKGKLRKGITVWQLVNDGDTAQTKIESYFSDKEAKKAKNGFPEPDGDTKTYDKDDWKMYFMKTRKFLVGYTEENIIPKLANNPINTLAAAGIKTKEVIEPTDEINVADVPFE